MKIYQVEVEGSWCPLQRNKYYPKYELYVSEENAKKRLAEGEYLDKVVLVTHADGSTDKYWKERYQELLETESKKRNPGKVELVTVKKNRYQLTVYDTID